MSVSMMANNPQLARTQLLQSVFCHEKNQSTISAISSGLTLTEHLLTRLGVQIVAIRADPHSVSRAVLLLQEAHHALHNN